jgi:rhodanese-related sulfurtransferase
MCHACILQPRRARASPVAENARSVSDRIYHWRRATHGAKLAAMTASANASLVTRVPAASPQQAHDHFARRLAFETDAADVARDVRLGAAPFTLVDVRSREHYEAGHLPGAINAPGGRATELPPGLLVVYCWGPGCNGAHRAAARLSAQGRQVKEMLGGFEYWVREGHPVEGSRRRALAQRADHVLVG